MSPDRLYGEDNLEIGEIVIIQRNIPKFHEVGGRKAMSLELSFFSVTETKDDVVTKVRWN